MCVCVVQGGEPREREEEEEEEREALRKKQNLTQGVRNKFLVNSYIILVNTYKNS